MQNFSKMCSTIAAHIWDLRQHPTFMPSMDKASEMQQLCSWLAMIFSLLKSLLCDFQYSGTSSTTGPLTPSSKPGNLAFLSLIPGSLPSCKSLVLPNEDVHDDLWVSCRQSEKTSYFKIHNLLRCKNPFYYFQPHGKGTRMLVQVLLPTLP